MADADWDRTRTVKARIEPEVFAYWNHVRRSRGLSWATVVAHGVAAVEEDIPPIHERHRRAAEEREARDDPPESEN